MRFCLDKTLQDVIFIYIIVCKAVSMAKIDFDHTKAIDTESPYPLFVCVCVFFFFLLVKNFERLDPPPDENSWIRASSGFFFSKFNMILSLVLCAFHIKVMCRVNKTVKVFFQM